ncbi:MAG: nitroreductase family protein [Candidatus Azobacteroides sp.]|nr:nitroreductase family protein [Candidatus Azobacteroides sp.]
METMKVINNRKSVRSYTGEKISEDELQTILKAANEAPVGMGKYENVHITVIEKPELLNAIEQNAANMFGRPDMQAFYGAPVYVLISAKPMQEAVGNLEYSNAAIIVQNMALAAVALCVGCCYIWGATMALSTNPDLVKQLNLPEGFSPCCGIILGVTTEPYTDREIPDNRIVTNYIK